jgi:hypothetical protein
MGRALKDELHEFDNYFEDAPTNVGERDRVSSKLILWHLAGAFVDKAWKFCLLITYLPHDVLVVNRARPLFHLSQSSHGHRERSKTYGCYQIYCFLTPLTAGLRLVNCLFLYTPRASAPLLCFR